MSANPLLQDLKENTQFSSTTVTLPTRCTWYGDDMFNERSVPDDPTTVTVGVLGVLCEQNFKDPWMILSGEGMIKVINTICPEISKPEELCDIDLDAILLASRYVSYSPTMELLQNCTNSITTKVKNSEDTIKICGAENNIQIDVLTQLTKYTPMTNIEIDKYTCYLEKINQTAFLKPLTYKQGILSVRQGLSRNQQLDELSEFDTISLVNDKIAMAKYSSIVNITTHDALDTLIDSIAGIQSSNKTSEIVKNKEFIKEWLLLLPIDIVKIITDKINELMMERRKVSTIIYKCVECGEDNTFQLELDAARLFGQAEVSKMPMKLSHQPKNSGTKKTKPSRVLQP